ncbi:MAG: nucleoside monophosphate kinase [Deltaproteobacteria bacterium]|nr:nucleoside monophosphate kinase [Deltaproteobacteria bacterium]
MATEPPATTSIPGRNDDLQIKDARIIFDTLWAELNARGREALRFPKELILLGGAPGAGKGTNTDFISKARGLTRPPIVMSELLDTPKMKTLKDAGHMIGDREVLTVLLRELHKPEYRDGAILDGFPRTKVQVEFLKMLHEEMTQLWREFHGTAFATHFRKPTIHIVVLFVDEHESIARQLKRGRLAKTHNENVRITGRGELLEERATDFNEVLAARRYRVFKEKTWDALVSLKDHFHYHLINAQASIAEVEEKIAKEFRYQSSLELDPFTFTQLRSIPLASEIIVHARQELVKRLDSYALNQDEVFVSVVALIESTIMPVVVRHAISGYANINLEDAVLHEPDAIAMLIDVFSERGFHAVVDVHHIEIPESIDLSSGKIQCRTKRVFRIGIRFKGSEIRRG